MDVRPFPNPNNYWGKLLGDNQEIGIVQRDLSRKVVPTEAAAKHPVQEADSVR